MREFSVFVMGIAAFTADMRRAIAVDAPLPTTLSITDQNGKASNVTVPAHFAYLRLPAQHMDQALDIQQQWDVSAAPGAFPPDGGPDPLSRSTFVQFLRFHEVILPASTTPADSDKTPLNAKGDKPGDDDPDATSALWLPAMSALGSAKTKVAAQNLVPNPMSVAAYVRFPNGKISTAAVSNFKFIGVSTATGKQAGALDRAVSQLMVCTMEVDDGPFTVRCRDYATPNGSKSIDIKFKGGVADPWMIFACTSLEDTLQLPSVEDKFGADFHFSLVYGLAGGPAGADVLPKSIQPAPGAPRPLGASRCVPPYFDGV